MSFSVRVVAIPAGKCPIKLKSSEYEDVIEWAEEVYSYGLKNNLTYLPSAIIFFAQQFFSIFEEDYKSICNHINSKYNTGQTEFNSLIEKINVEKRIADKEKIERKEKARQKEEAEAKIKSQNKKQKIEKPKQEVIDNSEKVAAKKIVIRRK